MTPTLDLSHIRYEERENVAVATFDRPSVHNAIGPATMVELARVLDHLESTSDAIALIVTGAGDRTFVSGGDLKELEQLTTYDAAAEMSRTMQKLTNRMVALHVPVIGAINGDSFGGGCEVALACDIRIASTKARFAFKQVTIGITPAWGGRDRLLAAVGRATALRLLLTGEVIDAGRALSIGLVDQVVEPAGVMPAAMELAKSIAANSHGAVRAIKHALHDGRGLSGDDAIEFEADIFARTWISDDHLRAVEAWKRRRG